MQLSRKSQFERVSDLKQVKLEIAATSSFIIFFKK